jgi:VWFA-related protein
MRGTLAASVLTLLLTSGSRAASRQQEPPTFRASVDAVLVDVAVRAGNTPVNDLTTTDFALWDQGVRQEIRAIRTGSVPLDVTLIVDVSRSRAGNLAQFRADVNGVPTLLQPADRVRLLAFSNEVTEIFPFQPGALPAVVNDLKTGSFGAVHEALATALMYQVEPDRRHLVVAFTDGLDNISALSVHTLQAIAKRTPAVLHLVIPSDNRGSWASVMELGRTDYGDPFPVLLGTEGHPRYRDMVIDAAEITGGQEHRVGGLFRGESILGPLKQILSDYRRSYQLQYQPSGVARGGWHELKVEVTRRGRYNVRARRGYFVDAK